MARRVLVIGGGGAGISAAARARELDKAAEITVLSQDPHVGYSPCGLPYVLGGEIPLLDSLIPHRPDYFRDQLRIDLRTGVSAIGLDLNSHRAEASDGRTIGFDGLVLAMGGAPQAPPIPGCELPGVHSIRTIEGMRELLVAASAAKSAVVIGAGLIGLEIAVALQHRGIQTTVLELLAQPIPRLIDADLATLVAEHLAALGMALHTDCRVKRLAGAASVEAVETAEASYPADLVILATGVRPSAGLARDAGIELGPNGGLRTTRRLEVFVDGETQPDIFAAGDVAELEHAVTGKPFLPQLGTTAVRTGRVAGANVVGGSEEFPPCLGAFISVVGGLQIGGTGLSETLARAAGLDPVSGKAKYLTRSAYYPGAREIHVKLVVDRKTRRLIGAELLGWEEVTQRVNWLTALIAAGLTIDQVAGGAEAAYCPPTSPIRDVVQLAAEVALRRLGQA